MTAEQELPQYHVLNFFHDDDDACALTALVHHIRYHVIVEPDSLEAKSKSGDKFVQEYRDLLQNVKEQEEKEDAEIQSEESKSRSTDENSQETHDSGVDVADDNTESSDASPHSKDTQDPRTLLYRWILTPLVDIFATHKPHDDSRKERTVQKWYYCKTHFFTIHSNSSSLTAHEESPSASLSDRITKLLPTLHLPKYLRALEIPMISASSLVICSEAADPDPVHPALVRERTLGEAYFLKIVDPSQPGPTKREIRLMKEIEKKGLHKEIRMPLVKGLVYFDAQEGNGEDEEGNGGDKTSIMGFLMDPIEDPTPLTCMLDSEVEQEKRETWAKEAERMVGVLHDNGIVWGDAKGDNFIVDKEDRLWIIDFGGSYTPGWIDPELKDTEEGDNQGLTRLVNGLMDPEEGTLRDEEEGGDGEGEAEKDQEEGEESVKTSIGRKRKAERTELDEDEQSKAKQRKGDDEEEAICECGEPASGPMIACDGKSCEIEWFHMSCVGIDKAPAGEWYCNNCEEIRASDS